MSDHFSLIPTVPMIDYNCFVLSVSCVLNILTIKQKPHDMYYVLLKHYDYKIT